jgi:hypothetical protein
MQTEIKMNLNERIRPRQSVAARLLASPCTSRIPPA